MLPNDSLTCRLYTFTKRGLAISSALSMPPLYYLTKKDIDLIKRCCKYKKLLIKGEYARFFITLDTHTPVESMLRYGYRQDDDIAITYNRARNSVRFYNVNTRELIMEEICS